MDEPSAGPLGKDAPDTNETRDMPGTIVEISAAGDVILDVVFETSKETLRAAKKTAGATVAAGHNRPSRQEAKSRPGPVLKPKVRVGYRVQLAELRRQSKYFDNLLGDSRFQEARSIAAALEQLAARKVKPAEAEARDLALVRIVDDDEQTRSAGREAVFGDLLRVLHGQDVLAKPVTMAYVATMAVLADRFACTGPLSRYLNSRLKFRWPATPTRREERVILSEAAEEMLRQKILVSWLLDQPLKMHAATRELVMLGSCRWAVFPPEDGADEGSSASWWDLPDGLESELQHRRECVLNTIGSVQRHFLRLYTSRDRQCKLGYDSSSSCDSYQLGEMVKFLSSRNLAYLIDFSPASLDALPDLSVMDIDQLLATLKQCSAYQIDKNHTNCGLRTRVLPILDYIQSMLSSNVISIARSGWKKNREAVSWLASAESGGREDDGKGVFRFTRSMAGEQRLRYDGAMAADRMARELFTATAWDWTPED